MEEFDANIFPLPTPTHVIHMYFTHVKGGNSVVPIFWADTSVIGHHKNVWNHDRDTMRMNNITGVDKGDS